MSKKILLVDDDLYLRELYEEVLQTEGFQVETGNDGTEGLAKLQQGGYDLILLDLMMPKLDGAGVLDYITKNPPAQKNGPIILLTNLKNDPLLETLLQKGANGSLIKADLTPEDFLNKVKKILESTPTTNSESKALSS